MLHSGGSLDSTVVTANDNSAEVFAAFELQSKEFQNVQLEFENYMERLKEDIDLKAEKFEHIDYYDALLRDGNSKDIAVAASEVHELEERRKPLITVNPLFAKVSEMPPVPSVENLTYEHISLNLPAIAKNALNELDGELDSNKNQNIAEETAEPKVGPSIDMTSPSKEINLKNGPVDNESQSEIKVDPTTQNESSEPAIEFICPQCKTKLSPDLTVCPECGTEFSLGENGDDDKSANNKNKPKEEIDDDDL